jgi:hypothetical protein
VSIVHDQNESAAKTALFNSDDCFEFNQHVCLDPLGSGPARTAHGSLDLKEMQIQIDYWAEFIHYLAENLF